MYLAAWTHEMTDMFSFQTGVITNIIIIIMQI